MQPVIRITFDPHVMGGKPCLRGLRFIVESVVGLVASGYSTEAILDMYPYLESENIDEARAFAAYSMLGEDRDDCDVEYAAHAQVEVMLHDEAVLS